MEGAMNGWTKSETLLILECLTKVNFDELQKKIPTKNRKEIKEAVLFTVKILADAPPKKSDHNMSEAEWTQFIIHNHKTGEFNLPPPGVAIPYLMKLVICLKELFHQMSNAFDGRPVVPDSTMIEILRFLASDLQALYDFCGGDDFPDIQKYNTLIGTNLPFLPRTPASKHQQKKEKKKKETKNASPTPSMYPTANNNHTMSFAPASADNPPLYTPANPNMPQYMFDVQVSNVNPPKYTPLSRTQLPLYVPSTANITTMYGPAMNTPAKNENPTMYSTATKSNIPSMMSPATCSVNSMYAPAINHAPTPVYVLTNHPPLNAIATNNIPPPVYHHPPANQTQPTMNAFASNHFQPDINATATGQHNLINAPADFNSIYGPAQNNSYNPRNANIMPSYVGACERNFEPSNMPAGLSRLEPPSRHA